MRNLVLLVLLISSLSLAQDPALQKITLKCISTPNSLGDYFEYDFKIEERINGLGFEMKSGSTAIMKPLNNERGIPSWNDILIQPDKVTMSKDICDRFMQLCFKEKFLFDRQTQEFTMARSTREYVKTSPNQEDLIQIQSGTCSEK